MTKKIIFPVFAALIAVFGLAQTNQAYAQTNSNPFASFVQAIAQKFGLDQNQVQSVVNSVKSQNKAKRQQVLKDKENTRLDQLVNQGKITTAQKQQILDEIAKLQSEYPMSGFKSETSAQRKAQMQKIQAEITAWSSSTGIDKKYLLPFGVFGMGMRRGWFNHKVTPTPMT